MTGDEILAAVLLAASAVFLILTLLTLYIVMYCMKNDKNSLFSEDPKIHQQGNHTNRALEHDGNVTTHGSRAGYKDEWPGNYEMHVVSHSYAFPIKGQRSDHDNENSNHGNQSLGGSTRSKQASINNVITERTDHVTTTTTTTHEVEHETFSDHDEVFDDAIIREPAHVAITTPDAHPNQVATTTTHEVQHTTFSEEMFDDALNQPSVDTTTPDATNDVTATITTHEVQHRTYSEEKFDDAIINSPPVVTATCETLATPAAHLDQITADNNMNSARSVAVTPPAVHPPHHKASRPVSVSSSTGVWKYNTAPSDTTSQYSTDRHSTTSTALSHQHIKEQSYYSSFKSRNLSVDIAGNTEDILRDTNTRQRIYQSNPVAVNSKENKMFTFKLG